MGLPEESHRSMSGFLPLCLLYISPLMMACCFKSLLLPRAPSLFLDRTAAGDSGDLGPAAGAGTEGVGGAVRGTHTGKTHTIAAVRLPGLWQGTGSQGRMPGA